jgi:hypothetical protein
VNKNKINEKPTVEGNKKIPINNKSSPIQNSNSKKSLEAKDAPVESPPK